jgi:hypothetical protein
MDNFWMIAVFLSSGLGAYLFSMFFKDRSGSAFVACVIGIPGLVLAYAFLKGINRLLFGSIDFSFGDMIGLVVLGLIAFHFLSFVFMVFKADGEYLKEDNPSNYTKNIPIPAFSNTNISLACPVCHQTSSYNNLFIRTQHYIECSKCSNGLNVSLEGKLGVTLTSSNENRLSFHQLNCPNCDVKLKISQVRKKTEIRCTKCRDTFYVKP